MLGLSGGARLPRACYAAPLRMRRGASAVPSGDTGRAAAGTACTGTVAFRRHARPTAPIAGCPYCPWAVRPRASSSAPSPAAPALARAGPPTGRRVRRCRSSVRTPHAASRRAIARPGPVARRQSDARRQGHRARAGARPAPRRAWRRRPPPTPGPAGSPRAARPWTPRIRRRPRRCCYRRRVGSWRPPWTGSCPRWPRPAGRGGFSAAMSAGSHFRVHDGRSRSVRAALGSGGSGRLRAFAASRRPRRAGPVRWAGGACRRSGTTAGRRRRRRRPSGSSWRRRSASRCAAPHGRRGSRRRP